MNSEAVKSPSLTKPLRSSTTTSKQVEEDLPEMTPNTILLSSRCGRRVFLLQRNFAKDVVLGEQIAVSLEGIVGFVVGEAFMPTRT
jgi:hypothetical protein